jgi:hypothetical protein
MADSNVTELASAKWARLKSNVDAAIEHRDQWRASWPAIAADMAALRDEYAGDREFGAALVMHDIDFNKNDRAAFIWMGQLDAHVLAEAMTLYDTESPKYFHLEMKDRVLSLLGKPETAPLEKPVVQGEKGENSEKAAASKGPKRKPNKREQTRIDKERKARKAEQQRQRRREQSAPKKHELTPEERAARDALIAKAEKEQQEAALVAREPMRQPSAEGPIVFYGKQIWPRTTPHAGVTFNGVWGLYHFVRQTIVTYSNLGSPKGIGSNLLPSVPMFEHFAPFYAVVLREMGTALVHGNSDDCRCPSAKAFVSSK